jgi:vacuolar-type H+-ATPase subunit H
MRERPIGEPGLEDTLALLERLEEVLGSGSRLPFTGRVLVDIDECFDIVGQIGMNLPGEFRQARRINSDREALIEEARARAEQIIRSAEADARDRVKEHYLTEEAQARADEMLADAERRAADIRREAYDYAYQLLRDLDRRLQSVFGVIREGMEELRPDYGEEPDEAAGRP